MTEKIYSKVQPETLLAVVYTPSLEPDSFRGRKELTPANEFLQCSRLKMPNGQTFKPHKHISIEKTTNIAQEAWVIMRGIVKVVWYDLDDQELCYRMLFAGDTAITFRGGHTYEIQEEGTQVYEFKTGPYWGQEFDKVFLAND